MRYIKVRGHKKRHFQIENWRLKNLKLSEEIIEKYHYDYIKIIVHPWCDLTLGKSYIPEPKSKTKLLILNGLIDIYNSWKTQMDKIGKPYYLKIWIFEPRFTKSQVVCAIDERIEYYVNHFQSPDQLKVFHSEHYGKLKAELDKFNWELKLDEEYYSNEDLGEPEDYLTLKDYEFSKKWIERIRKKAHRIELFKNNDDRLTEFFILKKGNLWIGEK